MSKNTLIIEIVNGKYKADYMEISGKIPFIGWIRLRHYLNKKYMNPTPSSKTNSNGDSSVKN